MSDPLYQFLERLQEHQYAASGRAPVLFDPELARTIAEQAMTARFGPQRLNDPEVIEAVNAFIEMSSRKGPTKYEDPGFHTLLSEILDHIEIEAAEVGVRVPRPVIGTLASGYVNAVSIKPPKPIRGHLILFEDQMFTFANLLAKALALAIPFAGADDAEMDTFSLESEAIDRQIATNPVCVQRFAEVVTAYARSGRPSDAPQYFIEGHAVPLAELLRDSLEYFVLGHEYSHVALGHLDSTVGMKGLIEDTDTEALAYSWGQELDADALGARLGTGAYMRNNDFDFPMSFAGADFFFTALEVMDKATALLASGDEEALQIGSHPPASMRRERLREAIGSFFSKEDAHIASDAAKLADGIAYASDRLWQRTRPILNEARARGITPWENWRLIPAQ